MTTQTEPARPAPVPDEVSAPYFEGARNGKLMLMRCLACGAWRFPARDRCDRCWSTETEWAQASGEGTLFSFVLMHQVYHPAFAREVPYNVAVVELAEGIRLTTNIVDCPNEAIHIGMPVQAVFEPVSDTVALPKFRPARG